MTSNNTSTLAANLIIPADRAGTFAHTIKDLTKRARRMGVPTPSYTTVETMGEFFPKGSETPIMYPALDVALEWALPEVLQSLEWELVADLTKTPDGHNQINWIYGDHSNALPCEWLDLDVRGAQCDHCQKQVWNRKHTVLIHHKTEDVYRQVGHSCLKAYTDGMTERAFFHLIEMVERFQNLEAEVKKSAPFRGVEEPTASTGAYIARQLDGQFSQAFDNAIADEKAHKAGESLPNQPSRRARVEAAKIIRWGQEIIPQDAGEWSNKAIAMSARIYPENRVATKDLIRSYNLEHYGLASSLLHRAQAPRAPQVVAQAQVQADQAGNVPLLRNQIGRGRLSGQRIPVTVDSPKIFNGRYGKRALVRFVTCRGEVCVWWTSVKAANNAVTGCDAYLTHFEATNTKRYRGTLQTVVKHCHFEHRNGNGTDPESEMEQDAANHGEPSGRLAGRMTLIPVETTSNLDPSQVATLQIDTTRQERDVTRSAREIARQEARARRELEIQEAALANEQRSQRLAARREERRVSIEAARAQRREERNLEIQARRERTRQAQRQAARTHEVRNRALTPVSPTVHTETPADRILEIDDLDQTGQVVDELTDRIAERGGMLELD